MTTKRETILAQIITSLAGTTNVSNRIYRSRVTPLAKGEMPCLIVEPLSDTPTLGISVYQWSLRVRISVLVKGTKANSPDKVADSIIESVHSKLCTDPTLNNTSLDIEASSVTWELIDADQASGIVSMDYIIRYQTLPTDLTN
mgnify:CR=1 FL=1